jgi:hypothetical protein
MFIFGDGQTFYVSPKIHDDFWRRTFYLRRPIIVVHLQKMTYRGRNLRGPPSENRAYFFRDGPLNRPASVNMAET